MRQEFNKLPKSIRILNIIVLLLAYLTISMSLIARVSRYEPLLFLKNWNIESAISFGVIVLLASPFFSLLIFLLLLRVEQYLVTGKFYWFFPKPGTLGNPIIDDILGKKGTKALNLFVKILVVLLVLVFSWIIYLEVRRY